NLSEMINGQTSDPGGFGTLLESLYAKNKKGYAILKDYELMPILIPQINRVLMFLVNECLSPDIQNKDVFTIKYLGSDDDPNRVQQDIDRIRKERKLDNMLRDVYVNRYKLGKEYYAVIDYTKTFDRMISQLEKKRMNESTAGMSDIDYLDQEFGFLTETVDDVSCTLRINALASPHTKNFMQPKDSADIVESVVNLSFDHLNIKIERSSISRYIESAHAELLSEAYAGYRLDD